MAAAGRRPDRSRPEGCYLMWLAFSCKPPHFWRSSILPSKPPPFAARRRSPRAFPLVLGSGAELVTLRVQCLAPRRPDLRGADDVHTHGFEDPVSHITRQALPRAALGGQRGRGRGRRYCGPRLGRAGCHRGVGGMHGTQGPACCCGAQWPVISHSGSRRRLGRDASPSVDSSAWGSCSETFKFRTTQNSVLPAVLSKRLLTSITDILIPQRQNS